MQYISTFGSQFIKFLPYGELVLITINDLIHIFD